VGIVVEEGQGMARWYSRIILMMVSLICSMSQAQDFEETCMIDLRRDCNVDDGYIIALGGAVFSLLAEIRLPCMAKAYCKIVNRWANEPNDDENNAVTLRARCARWLIMVHNVHDEPRKHETRKKRFLETFIDSIYATIPVVIGCHVTYVLLNCEL
jgi:hypothetical protein